MRDWYVLKTPCYPAEWKVTYDNPDGRKNCGDNATCNFFRHLKDAMAEADRRNCIERHTAAVSNLH